jgi:hypothetical protein
MTPAPGVILTTGDANVLEYTRTFEELVIRLQLWDESTRVIRARGVTELHDTGTWECDALVRHPALDGEDRSGYAVVDTEGHPTLTFAATDLDLGEPVSRVRS